MSDCTSESQLPQLGCVQAGDNCRKQEHLHRLQLQRPPDRITTRSHEAAKRSEGRAQVPRDRPAGRRRAILRLAVARVRRRGVRLLIRGGRLRRAAPRALYHNAGGAQPAATRTGLRRRLMNIN